MAFSIKAAAIAFIMALEQISGTPIAILERKDDPQDFWARSAAILCDKTGDSFCDTDMRFMTQNTDPMGYSQVIEYKPAKGEPTKRVCAILPPTDTIDPTFVAEAFTGKVAREEEYPSNASVQAWLYLYWASQCLNTKMDSGEEKRAIAFASLGLTILQGDPLFTADKGKGQSRTIATMIKRDAAYWGVGTGERLLFDQFKAEVAKKLNARGCNAVVAGSNEIDTPKIPRDESLKAGEDCATIDQTTQMSSGRVTDSNVWLWMYRENLGHPPYEYKPAKMFNSLNEAAKYTWDASVQIAK